MAPPELMLPPEAWPAGVASPIAVGAIAWHALIKPPPKWLTLLMALAVLALIVLCIPAYIGAIVRVNDGVTWFSRMGTF